MRYSVFWRSGRSDSGSSLGSLVKERSVKRTGENWWPKEERFMILVGGARSESVALVVVEAALISLGRIRLVKRKWPMWFVAKVVSSPSSVRVRVGMDITPALLIRMSMVGMEVSARSWDAAARTDFWEDKSMIRAW